MNREILFRGKCVDNGEWVIGSLIDAQGKTYIVVSVETECLDGENTDLYATEWYEVQPDTICQYIELTDKNGNKIFKGDILRGFQYPFCHDGEYNYYAEIIFANCSFMTYTHKNPSSCVRGISDGNTELMECWISEDWEVIGNIYDNPELLEEEGN